MTKLKYLFSKKIDNETYTINWYDGPQIIENGYKFVSKPIKGIINIDNITDETFGETKTTYFSKFIKYKYDDIWSELISVDEINSSGLTFSCMGVNNDITDYSNLVIDPNKELIIELYYYKVKDSIGDSELSVNNIRISGEYAISTTDKEAFLEKSGSEIILTPKDIYKIFSLSDFILVSNHTNVDIKYRFTQDNNRTYTEWLPLNKENIASTKLNPLRFAKIEYLIKNLGDPLIIYDIILIGDFQNVSANYLKTNKYGLKEDCIANLNNLNKKDNVNSNNGILNDQNNFLSSCSMYSNDTANNIDKENSKKSGSYWNPYNYKKITDFANMLGNQVSEIFGWDVDYHLTDPDGNGIDMYVHEYTLKNVIDLKKIKVIVPENKFPVESIIINQFNLDLFDTFEIHIMKDEFKNKFGITRRPSEDDILYICEANMLYYIKHAQAFKDIMNAATYYKIILEKYEYKTNIRNTLAESKLQIEELTNNTTIESLFDNEMKKEEDKIANKEQFKPTTMDFIRHHVDKNVLYEKILLNLDEFIPVKSVYNFKNTTEQKVVVNYKKSDSLIKSDNRNFMFWFNFNNEYNMEEGRISNNHIKAYNITKNKKHIFLDNYNKLTQNGYIIYYKDDILSIKINKNVYTVKEKLLTNIWYICSINLNQKTQQIDINIYRRDGEINIIMVNPNTYHREIVKQSDTNKLNELFSLGYKAITNIQDQKNKNIILVANKIYDIEPQDINNDTNIKLVGSNIKISNIRIFNDIIPSSYIENIIKQNIIKDSQYLILADNATKKIRATNYYNKNWK